MRTILSFISVVVLIFMVASTGFAGPPVMSMAIDCNWGQLTMKATPLGGYASDPSGDGLGPEDRVGLANVVEHGNLQATCEFIESLIGANAVDSEQPFVTSMSVKCNWGQLTMESIPLGGHASDPSGDGLGPEDRAKLANIIERGNLQAVCEILARP